MGFEVGKSYNFTTIAPITLGANFTNVKVEAIFSFDMAKKLADVVTINEKVKSEAETSTLDPMTTQYIMVTNQDGDSTVLAIDWIVPDSVSEVSSINAVLVLENITIEEITAIKNVLNAMGYKPVISTEDET